MFTDIDCSRVTPDDAVGMLQALDREFARLHAVQADLLVVAAGAEPVVDEFVLVDAWTEEQRRILIEDAARDELACALRRSSTVMQDMIDTARLLAGPLRLTWAALHAGDITYAHVRMIAEAAERLPVEALEEFQRRVLRRAVGRTLAATRRAIRETVLAVDPDGFTRRRRQAKSTRDVWICDDVDGMSLLMARLATEQAIACKTQIDAAAHARANASDADPATTIGEHRVEALAAMILGGDGASGDPASGDPASADPASADSTGTASIRAHVNLTIDLPTLLGLQDDSAELTGAGPIPAAVVQELLADPDCAVTIRRLVTDPVTGHLLDYGRRTYEIPQPLRDYIVARDRTCRFPGCNRRADLCQIDHAIAWDDGGQTNPQNLGALCTRHHQLKTHGGWEITESRPDGSCVWRSPQGRTYESGGPEPPPSA